MLKLLKTITIRDLSPYPTVTKSDNHCISCKFTLNPVRPRCTRSETCFQFQGGTTALPWATTPAWATTRRAATSSSTPTGSSSSSAHSHSSSASQSDPSRSFTWEVFNSPAVFNLNLCFCVATRSLPQLLNTQKNVPIHLNLLFNLQF